MTQDRSDEQPAAAGAEQTDRDVASSLPPGSGRKADTGGRGDVDRAAPYDEGSDALRLDDVEGNEPIESHRTGRRQAEQNWANEPPA
jgi:hypothetical protein